MAQMMATIIVKTERTLKSSTFSNNGDKQSFGSVVSQMSTVHYGAIIFRKQPRLDPGRLN